MNRGFGFYFSQAMKTSASTLWKKGNLIKFFAYFLMELLARVTVVFGSLFDLADVRQAKIAQREGDINIPKSFKVACRREPLRTMITAIILEALLFIAGLLIIAIASCLLGSVGYIISLFVDTVSQTLLVGIFLIPGGLVTLGYFVIMPILLAPTAYVIETNPDITASEAISVCFDTMRTRGKFTTFLAVLIPALVEGAIIGLFYGACYLVLDNLWAEPELAYTLVIVLAIIGFIAFILVAPMFALARRITLKSLFEDIALDPVNASKHTNGINIRRCKGVTFDPSEIESQLEFLFDESESDRIPIPETPAQIRQREKEEKQREKERRARARQEEAVQQTTPAPASAVSDDSEEDDGELLTVSDLIRDVEKSEEPASEKSEEPKAEQPEKESSEKPEEEPVSAEPEKPENEAPAEEKKEEVQEEKTEEVKPDEPAEEPVKEESAEKPEEKAPVKKTATRTSTAKTTTTKSSGTAKSTAKATTAKTSSAKSTAKATTAKTSSAKSTATKSATASSSKSSTAKSTASKTATTKPATAKTATKSSTTKSTATKASGTTAKSTTAKTTASKSATTKTTGTKSSTAKSATSKTSSSKTTASKTTTAKKTADKPAK